jgi:hypothetical protein
MSLQIDVLGPESLDAIDSVHRSSAEPLVYGSASYIRFLLTALPNVRFFCPAVTDGDSVIGTLPLLEQTAADGRIVLNSLPFFGSHGGPCWLSTVDNSQTVQAQLLRAASEIARERRAISITLVESPLQPIDTAAAQDQGFAVIDYRIGQFTALPYETRDVEAALFDLYHVKTRNAVRKGQKLGQVFERRIDDDALNWLQSAHAQSIMAMGGVPKSKAVFNQLLAQFPLESKARLYIGTCDGRLTSGLLVLLFQDTVEYFTPVVDPQYKDQQALSALIHHVMLESVYDGYRRWNWGGTWPSQEGVYRFKSRFGASEFPYRYFHKLFDPTVLATPHADLRAEFPYFYTCKYKT